MSNFSFFADAYLAKSGNKNEPYRVGGILTTEDRDSDGEIVKSVDWSYFTGGFGKIKYEHNEVKGPDAIIGFPTKLFKSGKAHHFEGELVPFDPDLPEEKLTIQQRLAKSTVSLLQHIEDFNSRHKGTPQKAGWSIEGEYLAKDATGLVKARAVNVVFTTKPRNTNTLATLIKSLDMGYGMSPDTQTGFAAFRKESLDKKTKINDGFNHNHSINKGEGNMFNQYEDIYKSTFTECKAAGKTDEEAAEEAKKKAGKTMHEKRETKKTEFAEAEKSLGSSKSKLEKSVSTLTDLSKVEFDIESVETSNKKMEKSIKTIEDAEKDEADFGLFFKSQASVLTGITKSITAVNQKIDLLAKSLSLTNEALIEQGKNDSFVANLVTDTNDALAGLEKSTAIVANLAVKANARNAKSFDLHNIDVADNNKDKGKKALNKSVISAALLDLSKDTNSGITTDAVIKFETTNQISDTDKEILKSKRPDLYK